VSWILAVLGLAILAVMIIDITQAVFLQGGGPLTRHATFRAWRVLSRVLGRRGHHHILATIGVALSVMTLALWFGALWVGWGLVLSGFEDAVLDESGAPESTAKRFEYAGHALVTLSIHPSKPGSVFWSIVTSLVSLSGFATISLSAAYLLPVVSAGIHKRQLAQHLAPVVATPIDLARAMGDERHSTFVRSILEQSLSMLIESGEQHHAYPVLHLLHATEPRSSPVVMVAKLDEGLTLWELTDPDPAANAVLVHTIRCAIDSCIGSQGLSNQRGEVPPVPDINELREAGLQIAGTAPLSRHYARLAERRRVLCEAVEQEGFDWNTVVTPCGNKANWHEPYPILPATSKGLDDDNEHATRALVSSD